MSGTEAILAGIKEMILPDLAVLRQEQAEIKASLVLTNKRLDDVNTHMVDQSRRIDTIREGLEGRFEALRTGLEGRFEASRTGLEDRFEALRTAIDSHLKNVNERLDQLYAIVVRREEHYLLTSRVQVLEQKVAELEKRVAA
jgi:uncharacterized protein YktB (UPF0637 family)